MTQDTQAALSPAPASRPAEAPAPPVMPEDKVDQLLGALVRQGEQMQALTEELRSLASRHDRLIEAIQAVADPSPTGRSMAEISQHSEEMANELQSLAENSERQIDLLQKIQIDLASINREGQEEAESLARLSGALENLGRNSASHAELMEQIRDRLSGANDELAETVASQGRRVTWLLVAALVLLAAVATMLGTIVVGKL